MGRSIHRLELKRPELIVVPQVTFLNMMLLHRIFKYIPVFIKPPKKLEMINAKRV